MLGLALGVLALAAYADCKPSWTIVHKQSKSSEGSSSQPSIRYSHSCAAYKGNLLLTHGYFYDRQNNFATWKSDTWAMSMSKPPHKWKLLQTAASHEEQKTAYSSKTPPSSPCGRFGHATTVFDDTLFMYGGHDGGYSRHGQQNYEPGYDFEELWAFNLTSKSWTFLHGPLRAGRSPGKRYLATLTALSGNLVLYGGMNEGNGDVWIYNLASSKWTQAAIDRPFQEEVNPGRRVGHTMTPVDFPNGVQGFVLFGGRSVGYGGDSSLQSDAWFYDLLTNSWRLLRPSSTRILSEKEGGGEATVTAPARKYHAEAHLQLVVPGTEQKRGWGTGTKKGAESKEEAILVGVVMGGSVTTPGLTCAADAWAFTLDCTATKIYWVQLPDQPLALYDGKAAANDKEVFMFGGHLCKESLPEYPYYYTNMVAKLDLSPFAASLAAQGCRSKRTEMLASSPHLEHQARVEL